MSDTEADTLSRMCHALRVERDEARTEAADMLNSLLVAEARVRELEEALRVVLDIGTGQNAHVRWREDGNTADADHLTHIEHVRTAARLVLKEPG